MSVYQGLSNYNGQLYAAWKGVAGDDRLFYSQYNGTQWTPQTRSLNQEAAAGLA
jgi:hypothetical protein